MFRSILLAMLMPMARAVLTRETVRWLIDKAFESIRASAKRTASAADDLAIDWIDSQTDREALADRIVLMLRGA